VLAAALGLALVVPAAGLDGDRAPGEASGIYVADFVATAATGAAMNDLGDVAGTSYPDPGCGPFCLPPQETVVWRGGVRIVLPPLPGFSGIYVKSINNQGWVAGFAGFPSTMTRAVVWKPNGPTTYQIVNLGVLPGTTKSEAVGIDNQGRVVGWSTTNNFPPQGSPFVWTEATGMQDMSAQGFPDELPLAISPGGTVATASAWYRLGDPGSVSFLPPAPQSFAVGTYPTAINDDGDQARFLVNTGPQNLVYLFRFHHEGTWQMLSGGTGQAGTYGIGSINAARDVSATVQGAGVIAPGPNGVAEPLQGLLSPAYGGAGVERGGPINASGQILTRLMIGNSPRLVKLTPAAACESDCIVVSSLLIRGKFIQDPSEPGNCSPEGEAYNVVRARVVVKDENGSPLPGVVVKGHFLDDYWNDDVVAGTTNAHGTVNFTNKGPCGVGAVAFLVGSATLAPREFDRTTGKVTAFVIPD
jgi:probable HAF family extracellular repeat protein